jgi:hypothetical protein
MAIGGALVADAYFVKSLQCGFGILMRLEFERIDTTAQHKIKLIA